MERTGRLCQRSVSAILLLGFTAVADADTLCVAPSGTGGCFANITDAVAAAATLDKITVAPGTYKESGITITGLDGVVIKGTGLDPSQVIVDAEEAAGDVFSVDSANVAIKNLTVRNSGNVGIVVTASGTGARLTDVRMRGIRFGDCIDIGADGVKVARADLAGCALEGISVFANTAVIKDSHIGLTSFAAIDVSGNGAHITNNTIETVGDSDCIVVSGDDALITLNSATDCAFLGINSSGSNPTISVNTILGTGGGVSVTCTQCGSGLVQGNVVTDTTNDTIPGISVNTSTGGLLVKGNQVSGATAQAFSIFGTGVIVGGPLAADANAASGSGVQQQPAFDVSGDTHTLQGNKAHDNFGDGFHIIGNTHTLTGNVAKFNGEDGIDIDGGASGVILDGNVAKGNGGVGIEVSPNVTIQLLTNNIAKKNNLDFCNDGAVTTSAGNHFGTTGTPGSCSIIGD